MCRNKKSCDTVDSNLSSSPRKPRTPRPPATPSRFIATAAAAAAGGASSNTALSEPSSAYLTSTTSASSGASSLNLSESLPQKPHIYAFSEIATATNNFLAKRISSSASWRCSIRGGDVVVLQRRLRRPLSPSQFRRRLSILCRSHHATLAKLVGASVSADYIYLVYEFVHGASLSDCLRNPRNPNFTVIGTWISRMQIATDLAQGLEYIHHSIGLDICLVHNHIKSSSVIVTDPDLHAKLLYTGAAELIGEISAVTESEIGEERPLSRSRSGSLKVEGTRGFMAPEITAGGNTSQKSDVYAFGVLMLELLSGDEPLRYHYDSESGNYVRVSVIETARKAVNCASDGKIRQWIDRRLRDSFPLDVAEKVTRVALECVNSDADKRPDMERVAGKISKLYLESKLWSEKMKMPTEISVSLAGR